MARHGRTFPMPRRLHSPVIGAAAPVFTHSLIVMTHPRIKLTHNFTRRVTIFAAAPTTGSRRRQIIGM